MSNTLIIIFTSVVITLALYWADSEKKRAELFKDNAGKLILSYMLVALISIPGMFLMNITAICMVYGRDVTYILKQFVS